MPLARTKTITATGNSDPLVLDWMQAPFDATVAIALVGAATVSYALQYTMDEVMNTPAANVRWVEDVGAPAATSTAKVISFSGRPVTAVRLAVASLTGAVELKLVQGM
jgi:hypothetical protein